MPHITAFARNQWYVAAYGAEVRRTPARPHRSAASRSCSTAPRTGEPVALADRCVHRRYPLSASAARRRRPGRVRLPRVHLRHERDLRARARSTPRPADRAGQAATPSWSRTPSSGSGRRPGAGRRDPKIPRAPWLASTELDDGLRTGAAGGALRAARRQPARPVTRDLPARRLHRHARGRRDADHHRGRRGARHRLRQPAHGRRRMPALLRQVHRPRGPDRPLAGHRVPPAVPVHAAQPHRAGRRPCRTADGERRRTPSTSRSSTRSRPKPRPRRTTSGPWPATSRSATTGVSEFLAENNRTVVLQDVDSAEPPASA